MSAPSWPGESSHSSRRLGSLLTVHATAVFQQMQCKVGSSPTTCGCSRPSTAAAAAAAAVQTGGPVPACEILHCLVVAFSCAAALRRRALQPLAARQSPAAHRRGGRPLCTNRTTAVEVLSATQPSHSSLPPLPPPLAAAAAHRFCCRRRLLMCSTTAQATSRQTSKPSRRRGSMALPRLVAFDLDATLWGALRRSCRRTSQAYSFEPPSACCRARCWGQALQALMLQKFTCRAGDVPADVWAQEAGGGPGGAAGGHHTQVRLRPGHDAPL